MSDVNDVDTKTASSNEDTIPPLVSVFVTSEVMIKFYKKISDQINSNKQISDLAGGGCTVCIVNRKSGLSRRLMLGSLDAVPMEYSAEDWKTMSRNHKHIPDRVLQLKPKLLITISSDAQLVFNVLKTIAAMGGKGLSKSQIQLIVEWCKEAGIGDVYQIYHDRLSTEDPEQIFRTLYQLDTAED